VNVDVIDLAGGKLFALPNPYALDGRVTSHPDDARGFAPQQIYVLLEGTSALVIETGYTVQEQTVLAQLDQVLTPSTRASLFPLSMGEFRSVCNTRPIVERFDVRTLYGPFQDGSAWVDFRPELVPPGEGVGGGKMANLDVQIVSGSGNTVIGVDEAGTRQVQALNAPLRLLPTNWVYDPATRALFTSDAFTHVWRPTAEGPWVVTEDDDTTTLDELVDYLLRTRFWWLAGANAEPLCQGMAEVFETHDVEIVAPSFGCVLQGRAVVDRHHELMQDALRVLADRPSIGLTIGAGASGGGRP
jgi:hypothetical protein